MMDSIGIQTAMTDFSDEHGDQELIKEMIVWLNQKMGGYWTVQKVREADEGRTARLALLEQLRHYINSIQTDTWQEMRVISQIQDFILQEYARL
jgi:hypothetical protein